MINILILCGIVVSLLVLFVLLFGWQIERHLRGNIQRWADEAEKKEESK